MPPPPDARDAFTDDGESGGDEPLVPAGTEPLRGVLCMHDDVEVSRRRPRCLHPTSQCHFRDWCQVTVLARRQRKGE